MFRDASESDIEKSKELRDLPDEIVDDDGVSSLPDEIDLPSDEDEETMKESSEYQHENSDSDEKKQNWSDDRHKEESSEKQNDVRDDDDSKDIIGIGNDSGEEGKDSKELTDEEINERQKKAIREAFERIAHGEKLTDAEKGNLGEMLMDQYYISRGYTPIHSPRVTDLEHKSGQGIDGVYEKTNPDGSKKYVIADAKVNSSKLNKGLADGTDQMSDAWIEKRLDNAVGKEKADEIRDAYEDDPDSVSKTVYHFSYVDNDDGTSQADVSTVDSDGNQRKDSVVVQVFDQYGNEIDGGVK